MYKIITVVFYKMAWGAPSRTPLPHDKIHYKKKKKIAWEKGITFKTIGCEIAIILDLTLEWLFF